MRSLFKVFIGLTLFAVSGGAQAKVSILVDKDVQSMTVSVDGVQRYTWPVSSGNPSHETPNGQFQTFRMEEDHYSKEFDDAPMPHAIFFTKQGHAIHGTDSVNRLGTPASHGCVRLSRENATTLWDLVKSDGLLTTTVTLTGSSQVALARNPRVRPANAAMARRDIVPAPPTYAPASPTYDATANADVMQPVVPSRRVQRQVQPQQTDDGYIYPADGTSSDQRYPAPPGYRRMYDAQAVPQQYYDGRGYVRQQYQPQVYVPRPYY